MRREAAAGLLGGLAALLCAILALGLAADWMGDPVSVQLGPEADAVARRGLRATLGLDLPFLSRLLTPLWDLAWGDLGTSAWLRRPVLGLVLEAAPVTLLLAALAWPPGVAGGIGLGLILAARPAAWSMVPVALLSLPGFVVAVVAVQVFSAGLGWLPASGFDGLRSLVLPATLLALGLAIKLGLLLQDRIRTVRGELFSDFAVARGLGHWRLTLTYRVLPSAALVARFGALHAGHLLGGALVIETVFGLPGLGRLAVLALTNRDLALLRACMLAAGVAFLLARFAAEAMQSWLDPRPSAAR